METGYVTLTNKWGVALLEAHIRHRRGNDPGREESKSFYCVPANETTGSMEITYDTYTTPSGYDYWWIKFVTLGGIEYETSKGNFYCNITSADNGNVDIRIDPNDVKMYITFSASSGCSQGLKKNN